MNRNNPPGTRTRRCIERSTRPAFCANLRYENLAVERIAQTRRRLSHIKHTDKVISIQFFTSPRTHIEKMKVYSLLADRLKKECALDPNDLLISVFTNREEDWSFAQGVAQYVTGRLPEVPPESRRASRCSGSRADTWSWCGTQLRDRCQAREMPIRLQATQ